MYANVFLKLLPIQGWAKKTSARLSEKREYSARVHTVLRREIYAVPVEQ